MADGYFRTDPTEDNDLALLPPAIRDYADMANVAASAEEDVLAEFTRDRIDDGGLAVILDENTPVERFVWLKGYAPDPFDAEDAFVAAYRREIANVIRWRIARDDKKPNVDSETASSSRTTRSYRSDAEERFPPDFGRALKFFIIGRVRWGI
jgi:hypothetical protein